MMRLSRKTRSLLVAATGGHAVLFGYLLATGNDKFYQDVIMPLARVAISDGETAHNMTVKLCKWGLVPSYHCQSDRLECRILGLDFSSPVGMAGGFDKNGDAVRGIYKMGFASDEVGSVTPEPQPGNARPRVFRLTEDRAIINRYGFPSVGHAATMENILANSKYRSGPLGINLGVNKTSTDVIGDFVRGVEIFSPVADYLVVNVSSPNTPGLRLNQQKDKLTQLLQAVMKAREAQPKKVPLLLKIAPDLNQEDRQSIADIALQLKIDGLIVCNTSSARPSDLQSPLKDEVGGLSGEPIKQLAQQTLRDMYILTKGLIPLVGSGGVSSGADAYARIRNGASLIQLYTAFTFQGPPLVRRINYELEQLLEKDGFSHVSQAVGADVDLVATARDTTSQKAVP